MIICLIVPHTHQEQIHKHLLGPRPHTAFFMILHNPKVISTAKPAG